MPVANYVPLAGKYGRISANDTVLNLSEHEVRLSAEDIDTSHFESDVSLDGVNVFMEGLVGMVDGEVMVRGKFDAANNPFITPIYLFPGLFGTMFAGLTKTYGFTFGYRCLSTPVSTAVKGAVGFEGRVKTNGLVTAPSTSV